MIKLLCMADPMTDSTWSKVAQQRWAIPYFFNNTISLSLSNTDTDTSIRFWASAILILVSMFEIQRYQYLYLVSKAKVSVSDTDSIAHLCYPPWPYLNKREGICLICMMKKSPNFVDTFYFEGEEPICGAYGVHYFYKQFTWKKITQWRP